MSDLGLALREARLVKNFTQESVGNIGFCSGKMISKIERGERQISIDVLEKVTKTLDDPRLYMEAANEITGGVFGVSWLDGDMVDLHRSSVKEKSIEELQEAIDAISAVKTSDNPRFCKIEQREVAKKSILEMIDVFDAAAHYIAIYCREYGFSPKELFYEHNQKNEINGYKKPR